MDKKIIKKIKDALYGIHVAENWPDDKNIVSYSRNNVPPSYMIKLIVHILSGQKNLPRGEEKSEWEFPLFFDDKEWIVSDWRRSSWEIFGMPNCKESVNKLEKKLQAAATVLDNYIKDKSKQEINNDNLSVQNHYHKAYSIYSTFCFQLSLVISENYSEDELNKNKDNDPTLSIEKLNEVLNLRANRLHRIECNLIATVIFFFSLTETIFDSCFSLCDRRGYSFMQFRSLDWAERFKLFINPSSNKELNELFGELLEIRKFYRHIPVHSNPEFFVHIDGLGLVPTSYKSLYKPHMLSWWAFDENEATRIIQIFDKTLGILKSDPNTLFGYLYAKSGLPIHIEKIEVDKLKMKMVNEDEFEAELNERCRIQDAFDNMEI